MTAPVANPSFEDTYTPRHILMRHAHGVSDPAIAETVSTLAQTLEEQLVAFEEVNTAITSDRMLSPAGKTEKRLGVAQEGAKRIRDIAGAAAQTIETEIAQAEASLFAPHVRHRLPSDVDPADSRAIESEIRSQVKALDPMIRDNMYLDAAKRRDRQFMRALEQAPQAFPLVSPKAVAEGAELFAAAEFPDDYAKLLEKRSARSTIAYNAQRAIDAYSRMAGRPVESVPLPTFL